MDYTLTVTDGARSAALTKALSAFNASNTALSEQSFLQRMLDAQLDSLVGAYLVTTVSKLAFLNRFTTDERIAIRAAAQTGPAVEDYLEMLNASEEVNLTHALTVSGVQALEAGALIAAGRAAVILAL